MLVSGDFPEDVQGHKKLSHCWDSRAAEERNLLLEIKASNKNTCVNTKQMSKQIVIYRGGENSFALKHVSIAASFTP